MAQAPPCPYCGALSYRRLDEHRLVCRGCGHGFDIRYDLCPSCGHLNQVEATACSNCQSPLKKDTVDQILKTRLRTGRQWRDERVVISKVQKKKEAESSRRRMEAFWAEDQARQEAMARELAARRKRERQVLLTIGIVAAVIVIIAIAVAIMALVA